jgi:ketosteroid isomerase-like protein
MSEEHVEIVRTALTALDGRDVELYLTIASPEIELITPAAALEGPLVGHEGIRQFFEAADEYTESSHVEIEEITAIGPRVLAHFRLTTVGRVSGAETSADVFGVYSFEGDKLRRAEIFVDREAALAAVDAPE